MQAQQELRRLRKGTKSCTECRKRKLRCDWANEDASRQNANRRCQNCQAHERTCVPQQARVKSPKIRRPTNRNRIIHLEEELASLAAIVNKNSAGGSGVLSNNATDHKDDLQNTPTLTDTSDVDAARSPIYLRSLFDNFAINTEDSTLEKGEGGTIGIPCGYLDKLRRTFQRLLPTKEEAVRLSVHASEWTSMYHDLFPPVSAIGAVNQIIDQYEQMCEDSVPPTTLAAYLLSLAITMLQVPTSDSGLFKGDLKACERFVDNVLHVVERHIVANNSLAGTVEGIETIMLFIRLQMGRGNLKNMWLTLRRAIALAEMIGLPHKSYPWTAPDSLVGDEVEPSIEVELWEAICATDRNASMMFNLPAGTASYPFPLQRPLVRGDGRVSPKAYNYRLAHVCAKIYEIDECSGRGISEIQSYAKIMDADCELRELRTSVPESWWLDPASQPLADQCVQFWHHYILARAHLRPSLRKGEAEQFEYSYSVCSKACRNAIERFLDFRPLLPLGFFICRVMDIQAFTAAVFLLIADSLTQAAPARRSPRSSSTLFATGLLPRLINTFSVVRDKAGSGFAQEAIAALNTLRSMFEETNTSGPSSSALQIPLLGKIRISHRMTTAQNNAINLASGDLNGQKVQQAVGEPAEAFQDFDPEFTSWLFEVDTAPTWFADSISMNDMSGWDWL